MRGEAIARRTMWSSIAGGSARRYAELRVETPACQRSEGDSGPAPALTPTLGFKEPFRSAPVQNLHHLPPSNLSLRNASMELSKNSQKSKRAGRMPPAAWNLESLSVIALWCTGARTLWTSPFDVEAIAPP